MRWPQFHSSASFFFGGDAVNEHIRTRKPPVNSRVHPKKLRVEKLRALPSAAGSAGVSPSLGDHLVALPVRGGPTLRDGDRHPVGTQSLTPCGPSFLGTSGPYSDAGNSAADSRDHPLPGSRHHCPASYWDLTPPEPPPSTPKKTLDPKISPSLCKASDHSSAGGSQPISQPKMQHPIPISPAQCYHSRSSRRPEVSRGPSAFKPRFWLSGP